MFISVVISVDGSSSTQSRFDLMVASTEVLNAETAISEIGWVFIRKELGSGHKWETNLPFSSAFVLPPLAANMLHKNAGSNFAGNVLLCKTQFVHKPDLSCFAKADLFPGCISPKNW